MNSKKEDSQVIILVRSEEYLMMAQVRNNNSF
jgi:hypothetical protein